MPRLVGPEFEPLYAAARRFIEGALRDGRSVFGTDAAIWSPPNLAALHARVVEQPIESRDSFEQKLAQQLDGAPAGVARLMAEILFVHLLASVSVGAARKRALIDGALAKEPSRQTLPADLEPALATGLAGTGAGFNTQRFWNVAMLIEFGRTWAGLDASRRSRLLAEPWEFREFVAGFDVPKSGSQREALLHLVHPDTFEPIVSGAMKDAIVARLASRAPGLETAPADRDRALVAIRAALAPEFGAFQFWDEPIARLWRTGESPWDRMIRFAALLYDDPEFDHVEREYKLALADRLRAARTRLVERDGAGGDEGLAEVLAVLRDKRNNIVDWRVTAKFREWAGRDPAAAIDALRDLFVDSGDVSDRVGVFLGAIEPSGVTQHAALTLASLLTLGIDAHALPPYRYRLFQRARSQTDTVEPPRDATLAVHHRLALEFLDRLRKEASARGLELRDRLDAQSVMWSVFELKEQPAAIPDREWQDLLRFRDAGNTATADIAAPEPGAESSAPEPDEPEPRAALAERLLLPVDFVDRIVDLLEERGQIVFQGPPGTGKTYVAREVAKHLAGAPERVVLTQFHPSYSYEDFVEGYRPTADGSGTPRFALRDGPLKRIASRAAADPTRRYVLVIDEFNRANVAKVLGELYYLLEYRDQEITLQYSDAPFRLPRNLWLIATMNTADRSIALVDAALRRRFRFVDFDPTTGPIAELLPRWLERENATHRWLVDAIALVNRELGDRHLAVGPSHFLVQGLDAAGIERIWEHTVVPYLTELLFGDDARLAELGFDAVRRRVTANGTTAP